ncbi:hypothetical protein THF1A12_10218 [Vibrio jasicida]|uniref:Uncharacterized protein n=1 Tax=Vibrio jasicida TaxID=766224 RepID=A0AAU9QD48_9VIBR|nr:hypothetical protein THF1A12_10218 [Vibrio jasicida]
MAAFIGEQAPSANCARSVLTASSNTMNTQEEHSAPLFYCA